MWQGIEPMTKTPGLTLMALFLALATGLLKAQTVTTFEGIDASQLTSPEFDVDPNGAVGTKQFMDWTNVAFQAYDKVSFAPVWPTTSMGKTITVTNHEKVTVNFTSVTVTGTDNGDFSQSNDCTSVASGKTCTVTVTFTPSAKGVRTAQLMFTDSAINSPQTANLSGTGD
jgi:hypothetical protein